MVSNDDVVSSLYAGRLESPLNGQIISTDWIKVLTVPAGKIWVVRAIELTTENSSDNLSVRLSDGAGNTIRIANSETTARLTYEPVTTLVLPAEWKVYMYLGPQVSGTMDYSFAYEEHNEL